MRQRERRLEAQRHNLELSLASSRKEVNDLRVSMSAYEARTTEMRQALARGDAAKRDLETKLSTVSVILRELRYKPATYEWFTNKYKSFFVRQVDHELASGNPIEAFALALRSPSARS